MASDFAQRKILSALCHGATFFNWTLASIVVPLVLLFVSDDPVVKENATESINFHINMYVYYAIAGILVFLLVGFLLLPILAAVSIVMPIVAIVKVITAPETAFRYPFIFRVI